MLGAFPGCAVSGVRGRSAQPPDQWLPRADQRCRNVMQVTLANSQGGGTNGVKRRPPPNVSAGAERAQPPLADGCAAIQNHYAIKLKRCMA